MANNQKMLRLYKVERSQVDYVLAESASLAEEAELPDYPDFLTEEVKEISTSDEGYTRVPFDVLKDDWAEITCGQWLEENRKRLQEEDRKVKIRASALAKLTPEEKAVILESMSDS